MFMRRFSPEWIYHCTDPPPPSIRLASLRAFAPPACSPEFGPQLEVAPRPVVPPPFHKYKRRSLAPLGGAHVAVGTGRERIPLHPSRPLVLAFRSVLPTFFWPFPLRYLAPRLLWPVPPNSIQGESYLLPPPPFLNVPKSGGTHLGPLSDNPPR